jgi:Transposase DDE domain
LPGVRSWPAYAAHGYGRSQHRHYSDFKFVPIGFELVAANVDERKAVAEILDAAGHVLLADKGYAGAELEALAADDGTRLLRPTRDEPTRHGSLGCMRQWIESQTARPRRRHRRQPDRRQLKPQPHRPRPLTPTYPGGILNRSPRAWATLHS